MSSAAEVWSEALPEIRKMVTGVGVWAALNASTAVALEGDVFVLGLPHESSELSGHLRLPQIKRSIEEQVGMRLNQRIVCRVIEGTTPADWETEKKRDQEKRRLQEQALARARKDVEGRATWEGIYEQLSRKYSATQNRSLPQNRAKFFLEAIEIIANALTETPISDELQERNYARCIERVAQYSELPSAYVAVRVLERTFGG